MIALTPIPRDRPVGRYAPSPTGELHLGNLRTALLAWRQIRELGGIFILRIEDLDTPRTVPDAEARMIEDLRWLGLDWDEGPDAGGPAGPYRQSERSAIYESALERLERAGLTYLCTCSRKDLQRHYQVRSAERGVRNGEEVRSAERGVRNGEEVRSAVRGVRNEEELRSAERGVRNGEEVRSAERGVRNRSFTSTSTKIDTALQPPVSSLQPPEPSEASAPHGNEGPPYPGLCRAADPARQRANPLGAAVRFCVDRAPIVEFADEIAGPQHFDLGALCGDFVIRRRDGLWAYQLACAVDDALMGVTHVLRGMDLITSTPRQVAIMRALGWPAPRYAHVPLVVDAEGRRMCKRDGSCSLRGLRESGLTPAQAREAIMSAPVSAAPVN